MFFLILRIQKSILDLYPNIDILSNLFIPFTSTQTEYLRSVSCSNNQITAHPPSRISDKSLAFQNLLAHPATILRRQIFNDLMYNSSYVKSQDYKCWLDAISLGYTLFYSPVPIIFYRSLPNAQKHFSQLIYSIRARLSLLNPKQPFISCYLIFGVV